MPKSTDPGRLQGCGYTIQGGYPGWRRFRRHGRPCWYHPERLRKIARELEKPLRSITSSDLDRYLDARLAIQLKARRARKCGCRTCQESMSYYLAARLAVAKIAA